MKLVKRENIDLSDFSKALHKYGKSKVMAQMKRDSIDNFKRLRQGKVYITKKGWVDSVKGGYTNEI